MNYLIVVSELHQLPPSKRWSMLVAPLAEELDNSGLEKEKKRKGVGSLLTKAILEKLPTPFLFP